MLKVGYNMCIYLIYILGYTYIFNICIYQFSCSVVSDSLQTHESQHARPPCLSPTPGVHSDHRVSDAIQPSHPLSSPSPASSCPQPLPASESFPMSQLLVHCMFPVFIFSWGCGQGGRAVCRILVSRPQIKPAPTAMEAQS